MAVESVREVKQKSVHWRLDCDDFPVTSQPRRLLLDMYLNISLFLRQITSSPIPIVYQTTIKPGHEPGVGVWSFALDPTPANTTISLRVASKGTYLTLSDVIFGDVWICSGQSNMEFTVKMVNSALSSHCLSFVSVLNYNW